MPRLTAPTGHSLELPDRHLTFGESPQCDIPLAAGYGLAPLHFETAPGSDGRIYLRDSSNGSGLRVNGQPITTTVLTDGDLLQAGALTLTFHDSPAPVLPAPPAASPPAAAAPAAPVGGTPVPAATSPSFSGDRPPAPGPPSLPTSASAPADSKPGPGKPPSPSVHSTSPSSVVPPLPVAKPVPKSSEVPPAAVRTSQAPAQVPGAAAATGSVADPKAPAPALKFVPPAARSSRVARKQTSPQVIRRVSVLLLLVALVAFLATDPGRQLLRPLVAKVKNWSSPPAPVHPRPSGGTAAPANGGGAGLAESAPSTSDAVSPQNSHQEITRQLLTERTQVYIYADLRQLIPTYNLMASQSGLPSQREMSDAFRRGYGAVLDGFAHLGYLQSEAADEFLMVLTSIEPVDLAAVIGQPARPPASGSPKSRSYILKTGPRPLHATLVDAFTLLIGTPRAIDRAIAPPTGPPLREARAMFPETAFKAPGALILVKRVNQPPPPAQGEPATAFETIITNLHTTSTPSTLSVVRNPAIPESAFVNSAPRALKEQMAALAPTLGTSPGAVADLSPGEVQLTINEASVSLPGGGPLISSALESLAKRVVRAAPTMAQILLAQQAVVRFNTARSTGAEPAVKTTSVRDALELLQEGVRGGGGLSGATFSLAIPESDLESLVSLLALDEAIGLVYRPDPETLSGSALDLAVKARDYRNAELLIGLWNEAKMDASEGETPTAAVRRVLSWAATPEGRNPRAVLGLPTLISSELEGALRHLAVIEGELSWKPGEANYSSWVRLVHPDPHGDAARLAAVYNAAAAAGAIPAGAARTEIREGINAIVRGVTGRGEQAGTTFKLDTFTPAELQAALPLLTLQNGKMTAASRPASP